MALADPIENDVIELVAVCEVFQPRNVYPLRVRLPVLPRTVTVAPFWYEVESLGTDPDDPPLAS